MVLLIKELVNILSKYINVNNALIKLDTNKDLSFDELSYLIDVIKTDQLIRGVKTGFKRNKDNESKVFSKDYFIRNVVKWALKSYSKEFNLKDEIISCIEYDRVSGKNQDKKT